MKNIYISSKLETKPEVFYKTNSHITRKKFCMFNLIDYYNIIPKKIHVNAIHDDDNKIAIYLMLLKTFIIHSQKSSRASIIKLKRTGLKWYHTGVNEIASGGKEIFYRISSCSFSDEKKSSRLKFFYLAFTSQKKILNEKICIREKTTIDFFNHTFRSGGSLSRNYIEMQIREKFTIIFYPCLICGNVVVGAAECEWNCLEKRFKAFFSIIMDVKPHDKMN